MSHGNPSPNWSALYQQYRTALLGALGKRGVPNAERYDLLHDLFLVLMKHHAGGRFEHFNFGGLAFRQCQHSASQRHRQVRREGPSRSPVEYEENEKPGAASSHQARAELLRLEAALRHWSAREQEVFQRCFVQGQSAPEVAAELKLSTQRIRSICCELRARCRSILDETP
jgi:RNA polymerase sigma factor (sigma-70 family)